MAPRLLPVQRQTIIALHKAGTKIIDISKWTGISRGTIYHWLQRFEETGGLNENHRGNYKRKTTNEQDTQIIAQHMYNPSQSTISTATQYSVSPRTIRRRLIESGVRQKIQRKKPAKPRAPKPNAKPAKKTKEQEQPDLPPDAWPYKCNDCGDLFKVRADLYNHNRLVHLGLNFLEQKLKNKKPDKPRAKPMVEVLQLPPGPSAGMPIPMMMGRPLWGAHYSLDQHNNMGNNMPCS